MNKDGYVKIIGSVDKGSIDIHKLNQIMEDYNIVPYFKFKEKDEIIEIDLIDMVDNNSWINDTIFPKTCDLAFTVKLPLRYIPKRVLTYNKNFDKMIFSIFHKLTGKMIFTVHINDITRREIERLELKGL